VQAVSERSGLVTREHFLGEHELLGHPQHKLRGREPLRRLGGAAIQDPHDDVATKMDVDTEFDRLGLGWCVAGLGLRLGLLCGALGFVISHWGSDVLGFPAPDHPCYLLRRLVVSGLPFMFC
jgi:hypothetical protein